MHQLNYFLLERLVTELRPRLVGAAFAGAVTGRKGELVLRFETSEGELSLRAGFGAGLSYLLPAGSIASRRRNVRPFFERWAGRRVTDLRLHLGERLIRICFSPDDELWLRLHGARGTVVAVSAGVALEAFRKGIAAGAALSLPPERPIPDSLEAWQQRLAEVVERKKALPAFDAALWAEVDRRGGDAEAVMQVIAAARTGPIGVEASAHPPALRLCQAEGYSSALEALAAWAEALAKQQGLEGQRARLSAQLADETQRVAGLLHKTQQSLTTLEAQRSREELGHLLMAQLHAVTPGARAVELEDYYQQGRTTLSLDPSLSAQQNAERLYAQHRADLERRGQLATRLAQLERRLTRLHAAEEALAGCARLAELKRWQRRWQGLLPTAAAEAGERLPYRSYRVGGYVIRVGRSAADNDALTLRHARPIDLWLHAKDVAGSHVVVVRQGAAEVPSGVVETAARLAAWHSKQRGATLAAVAVTPRKYVRKGRGMAPGQVRVERETVLLVPPLDPATLSPTASPADGGEDSPAGGVQPGQNRKLAR